METKRALGNFIFALGFMATLSLAQGCGSAKKQSGPAESREVEQSQPTGAESFGPPEARNEPSYGPDPIQLRPAVLVLGPGMARAFAHVGVLQAIKEARIPVGAVLGTEMGSLIAALYASEENLNELEWALLRFKEDAFTGGGISKLFKGPGNGSRLEAELSRAFGKKDVSDAKIPLRIMIQPQGNPDPVILDAGELATALRAALARPDLMSSGEWNGIRASASDAVVPWLLREARGLGIGPVIYVDASGSNEVGPGADADLILRPSVSGIAALDFKKRTEAAFRGKTVAKRSLGDIRKLVGLPENGLSAGAQP